MITCLGSPSHLDYTTMMRTLDDALLMLLVCFIMLAFGFPGCEPMPAPALSQDTEARPETATIVLGAYQEEVALWLARICVHEANWSSVESDTHDCGAIMQAVERRRSRGRSWIETLIRTSPRFFHGTSSRSWARLLQPGQRRDDPQGWPEEWPHFAVYADRWRGVYENALAFVRGESLPPCERAPQNWLSREIEHDREVAHLHVEVRLDWREVDCGQTVNAFFEPVDPATGEPR